MLKEGIKVVDENRQGEALAPPSAIKSSSERKVYIESYGCQMNFADSEVVASILSQDLARPKN